MAEHPWQPADPELEEALFRLGAALTYPPAPDTAPGVRAKLEAQQALGKSALVQRRWSPLLPSGFPSGRWRRAAVLLLAAGLVAAAILALSPAARASLGGWLRVRGVLIVFAPSEPSPTPLPIGTHLQLGRRLTITEAQQRVAFRILTPHLASLGAPDEIYLGVPPPGGQVALVYRARAGLPPAPGTGVGVLLTEFHATLEPGFFKKIVFMGTQLQVLTVNGKPAYWISGQPHLFGYYDAGGQFATEQLRLAGNTLLWEDGDLTLRMEGALSKDAALRIARSVR